ncbi:hypothetical protein [Vibrio porteresiae]|uniref:Uncharacterized protein n=1 Tax=Vibrio porteresiae DSM 19223 TaxID=1123496 RepID=A0ABZ0Q7Z3_9VIBR|nr:hypothetical protein [Vibrio porteresiae]WPC72549.1 hypothetical protein R8Z52_10425 [Vibrio porteresiae DSM 19223]
MTEHVYVDMCPDGACNVFLFGDWDYFKSYARLVAYLDSECVSYELHDITGTTLDERLAIMGVQL